MKKKNPTHFDGRALLAVAVLVFLGGCTAERTRTSFHYASGPRQPAVPSSANTGNRQDTPAREACATPPPGWPGPSSSDAEQLLAPFLSCTSPAAFVQLQRGVDMARLVER
ncbi:MAG TPA: hypothetical protein VEU33_46150, partial [Archangium sp.]|nr:hypothetical protein [Archangium sp.]